MKKINCILLIDDNSADNEFHSIIIKRSELSNQVKVTVNGEKALEYLKNSALPGNEEEFPKPDIIYLDINMPRMNGFEFLEEYNKLDEKMRAPVLVILTTSLNPEDVVKAKSLGANGLENKPLTQEMLADIIDNFFKE